MLSDHTPREASAFRDVQSQLKILEQVRSDLDKISNADLSYSLSGGLALRVS